MFFFCSDDVYEHMVFDKNKMIRVATLPGMWDRTITIGQPWKIMINAKLSLVFLLLDYDHIVIPVCILTRSYSSVPNTVLVIRYFGICDQRSAWYFFLPVLIRYFGNGTNLFIICDEITFSITVFKLQVHLFRKNK